MKWSDKLKGILFIGLVLVFYSACKNKDCHETGECPPEYYRIKFDSVKNYLFAKPGSYWIFENSVTGELDTQTCKEFTYDSFLVTGTQNYSKHITLLYDRLFRTIYSSYNGVFYFEKTNERNVDAKSFNNDYVALIRNSNSSTSTDFTFVYPFKQDIVSDNGSSITRFVQMDSTILIKGNPYYFVAKMEIDIDYLKEKGCDNYNSTSYYWSKNVGLIKKTLKGCNYSWELIDYKIIR